jgi:hypothetical protein
MTVHCMRNPNLANSLQNYTAPMLDNYQPQFFNASVQAQQYASGGVEDAAARAWVIVLLLVFLMNIFVLVYFVLHRGLVTDFSEPPNLFARAVNSPPSAQLAGSCGGGPEGKQYMVNWFVNHEGNHLFMEPGEKTALLAHNDAHGHVHGPVEEFAAPMTVGKEGVWASITGTLTRRLRLGARPPRKTQTTAVENLRAPQERPGSVVGSEYEMHEGYERTRKHYAKLANRRSVL